MFVPDFRADYTELAAAVTSFLLFRKELTELYNKIVIFPRKPFNLCNGSGLYTENVMLEDQFDMCVQRLFFFAISVSTSEREFSGIVNILEVSIIVSIFVKFL